MIMLHVVWNEDLNGDRSHVPSPPEIGREGGRRPDEGSDLE